MTHQFADIRAILFDILGPVLVLVLLGAFMRRKFAVDVGTLSRLTLYLFTPAFMFDQVIGSSLSSGEIGTIMLVTVIQVFTLGGLVWLIGRLLRVERQTLFAIAVTVMFYNSGNYGLPLAKLAFPGQSAPIVAPSASNAAPGSVKDGNPESAGKPQTASQVSSPQNVAKPQTASSSPRDGAAVQTFIALTQNLLSFTVGLWIASLAGGKPGLHGLWRILRLPFIPTIIAALVVRGWLRADASHHLPEMIGQSAHYLSNGLIPIALITLGAQLAANPRWPRWRPVSLVVFLRMVFAPLQMLAGLYLIHLAGWRAMDLWPWPAQLIVLTAGMPSAINVLVFTLELGGDAELTADCVFWTTVSSAVTVTGWLLVLRWIM